MTLPGFTAEQALVRSGSKYVANNYAAYRGQKVGITPQQRPLDAECCNISCPGTCWCENGQGHCGGGHVPLVDPAYRRRTILSAQLDHCRSSDESHSCYCQCGCIASDTTCGCFECPHPAPAPRRILRR